MPAERQSITPEQSPAAADLEAARAEKLAELNEAFKDAEPTQSPEKRAEKAREIIQREAKPQAPAPEQAAPVNRPHYFSHHLNYAQTLASVQRRLPNLSRKFSQVIHTPIIEKTSEALETTVARPSVLLGSTWTALIVGAIFYLVARHYGYSLSGSELLFSFIVGALFGLVGEGLWLALKRR